MFDEIFKRWITTGQLTENDIVPLFLEWNKTFGGGKGTAEEVLILLQIIHTDYLQIMYKILHDVGIAKGYKWEEVRDTNTGRLISTFFVDKQ